MTIIKARQVTILDMDFTTLGAQGTQVFSANQVYTIGGLPWTKINTANEQNPATLDSTGITFAPVSANDYVNGTRTLPGLHLPLQKVIPGFRGDMGVRIWVYNSFINAAANFDNAILAVDTGSMAYSYGQLRGFTGSGTGSITRLTVASANLSGHIIDLFTLGTGSNVMVLEIPSITRSAWKAFRGAFTGNNWPAMEALTQHNSYTLTGTVNTTGVTPQSLGVLIGAIRAGSATALSVKFARFRVDLLL